MLHEKASTTSGLNQITENNLITPSLDQSRLSVANKFSTLQSYGKTMFERPSTAALHPALFSSESRIPTWPWFYLSEVSNSSAATAAAIAFSKFTNNKEESNNVTKTDLLQLNKELTPCLPTLKEDNDIPHGANKYTIEDSGLFTGSFRKSQLSSSLPCSPTGNLSTSSSPLQENDERTIHHERSLSPMETDRCNNLIQVMSIKHYHSLNITGYM